MVTDVSNSRSAERDFLCTGPKAFLVWGVPVEEDLATVEIMVRVRLHRTMVSGHS